MERKFPDVPPNERPIRGRTSLEKSNCEIEVYWQNTVRRRQTLAKHCYAHKRTNGTTYSGNEGDRQNLWRYSCIKRC